MSTNAKTFRLFISSTFNDFKSERQVLHEKVFPVIDNYCSKKGYTFQPVDLRWGVNDEAQLDQKTLDLCLNEVKACKHYPHPNFLIMLGNRYGWVSLPYAIEKDEFESILKFYADNNEAINMLEEWYIEDTNHLMLNNSSHAYVIKERDPKGEYAEWGAWEKVESELRTLLQDATNVLFKDRPEYSKYFISATEAEVEEGIFNYLQPTQFQTSLEEKFKVDKDYVYGFVRTIKDHEKEDLENEPAKLFIDRDQTNVTKFRKELKDTLKASNIHTATVTLTDDKDNPVADDSYLKSFELFMIEKLENAVDKQIKEAQKVSELEQERSEQLRFKSLKTETFFGREEELEQIRNYIDDTTTTQPFIVHGISGIGKSSFIAKAIDQIEESLRHVVAYRFIGATASSSNIRTLLESLISDLADQGVLELPEVFEENSKKFNEQIKELLSNIEQPTVIVLDAMDQLQHKDWLQWLPIQLPKNLKVILSMLDQKGYEHYYDLLKNKIDTNNQLEIASLDKEVATEILDALLEKEKRTLTSTQKEYVLKQYHVSQSSPLYLKIAFEEVKTWKSTETTETLRVGIREIIEEFIDNLTKKFHHDSTIVHKVLGLISASRDGLSEKEILDLLSRDEKILSSLEKFTDLTLEIDGEKVRRFPISIWARLSEQLRPFLNEKLIDGQNLITFFHRQIEEAVRDYIYEPNKHSLHTELAEYFLTLQDKEQTWDKRYHNPHMLDEVPYQHYHAQDIERLKEILFDLEFGGSIYDHHKQVGFREIMEKASELKGITPDEIHPWESFYREKDCLITKLDEAMWRPHQSLCQLAYEDGDNSPLSKQAEKLLEENKIDFVWLKKKNRSEAYRRSGLLKVLEGHSNSISGVKILNDGRILSYAGLELRLWSSKGESLAVLKGHNNGYCSSISGVEILDDGRILSYASDGTLRLWSSEGESLAVLEGHTLDIVGHETIEGVEVLDDGRILSYGNNGTLRLWSSEGESLAVLEGHSNNMKCVKILDDGRILSYAEYETSLRLWSSQGESLAVLDGHNDSVRGVEILDNGQILSYAGNELRLWSSEGKLLNVLEGHSHSIYGVEIGVEILDNGRILSYAGYETSLRLWSSEGESLAVLEGHNDSIRGVEILDDGRILSYAGNELRLWSSKGKPLSVLEGHRKDIEDIEILDDGRILSYSWDGTLRIWSGQGESLAVLEGHCEFIIGVKILDDGRILSYSRDYTLRLWSSKGESLAVLKGHTWDITGIEILDDGRILTYSSSSRDKTLRLWSSEGKLLSVLEGHSSTINGVKILDDGRILSYSWDGTLRIWSGQEETFAEIEGHTTDITGVKMLDDRRILSYSWDGTLRIWSGQGESLAVLEGHRKDIEDIEILDDGRILSYAGNELRLWSSKGKPLSVLEGHNDSVRGVEILDNGQILSYAGNELRLWSSKGKPLSVLEGHSSDINGVKILDDGRILSYSRDYTLMLWSSEGESLAVLKGHSDGVCGVKMLVDGRILSYSWDGTLRIWSGQGKSLAVLEGHNDELDGAKILDDGRILSYAGNELRLWSSKGKPLSVLEGHRKGIEDIEILYDGRILSYAGNELRLWSSKGKPLSVLEGHSDSIRGVEILDNGMILSYDHKNLRVWSSKRKDLGVFKNIAITLTDIWVRYWTKKGKAMAVIEQYGGGKRAKTISERKALAIFEGHNQSIRGVKILDDGRIFSYDSKILRLWNCEGTQLNMSNLISDSISFGVINQETIIATNNNCLLLYDYYDGNKATTLEDIAKKSEALLCEDGI